MHAWMFSTQMWMSNNVKACSGSMIDVLKIRNIDFFFKSNILNLLEKNESVCYVLQKFYQLVSKTAYNIKFNHKKKKFKYIYR